MTPKVKTNNGGSSATKAPAEEPARVRRSHTRSRTGCLTCRHRHIRCDENHPKCDNCVSAQRECEYPTLVVPLRERRAAKTEKAIPGTQEPWVAGPESGGESSSSSSDSGSSAAGSPDSTSSWEVVFTSSVITMNDPFDSLGDKLPPRSAELLKYYNDFGRAPGQWDKDLSLESLNLSATVHEPSTLRNTIMLAGLHYSWNTGSLRSFAKTHFSHKVESIRTTNKWLENLAPETITKVIRGIITLAFVEGAMGSVQAADTHLNGLMTFLDVQEEQGYFLMEREDVEGELAQRYLVLVCNLIQGFKSRMNEHARGGASAPTVAVIDDDEGTEIHSVIRTWDKNEPWSSNFRLRALRLFPHFLSQPPVGTKLVDVDMRPVLEAIRRTTVALDQRHLAMVAGEPMSGEDAIWIDAGPSISFDAVLKTHLRSFSGPSQQHAAPPPINMERPPLISSWSCVCLCIGLYLQNVMGIYNDGEVLEARLLRRIIHLIRQDLRQLENKLADLSQDYLTLWMWKILTVKAAIDSRTYRLKGGSELEPPLVEYKNYFDHGLRKWSKLVGITRWTDVKAEMTRITWPIYNPNNQALGEMWDRTLAQSPMASQAPPSRHAFLAVGRGGEALPGK